jgi:hypothetical protein
LKLVPYIQCCPRLPNVDAHKSHVTARSSLFNSDYSNSDNDNNDDYNDYNDYDNNDMTYDIHDREGEGGRQ